MVVLLQMSRKEQVTAKHGDVFGEVTEGNVQVATLLRHRLEVNKEVVRQTACRAQ